VLDIMRDSRVGAYGAIGIDLMLLLKVMLLAHLPADRVVPALLLAHPCSRLLIRHPQPEIAPGICYGQADIAVSTGQRERQAVDAPKAVANTVAMQPQAIRFGQCIVHEVDTE
jgi:hypothetical protein